MPKFKIGDPVILADGQTGKVVEHDRVWGDVAVKCDSDGVVVYTFEEDIELIESEGGDGNE